MSSSPRIASVALVSSALALGACSSSDDGPRPCQGDAECPASTRCVEQSCVANALPIPHLNLPAGPLEANVVLTFDGSNSHDPDVGDAVISHAWTFRGMPQTCAAPVVAGTGPTADVRFACPGHYAVDLTVTDRVGASGTMTEQFDVVAYSGPPLVAAGADIVLEHACTGSPTRCAPAGDVVLSAEAPTLEPGKVSFVWIVEPPAGRALDANRRVTFDPSNHVASPTVTIETDGQAISGDWVFRVEAWDVAGLVGTAAMRVSVTNRAPVVTKTLPVVDHAFDGVQFTASGDIPFSVSDPDGDELVDRSIEWRHSGDGPGGVFDGVDLVAHATFAVLVPYAAPEDASHLIGVDLVRSIVFRIRDVNGEPGDDVWPIAIGNRAPVLVSAPPPLVSVDHRYDPSTQRYLADATFSSWMDPDGDPLSPKGPTGNAVCASYDVVGGEVAVHCSAPYPGAPLLSSIVGQRTLSVGVRDPWTSSSLASSTVEVRNRSPRLANTSVSLSVNCVQGACCRRDADLACVSWYQTYDAQQASFGNVLADDDGDPLNVTVNGIGAPPCVAASCIISGWLPDRGPVCGKVSVSDQWTVEANDTLAATSGTVTITRRCK